MQTIKYLTFLKLYHSSTKKLNKRKRPKSITTNMVKIKLPTPENKSDIPNAVNKDDIIAIVKAMKSINQYFIYLNSQNKTYCILELKKWPPFLKRATSNSKVERTRALLLIPQQQFLHIYHNGMDLVLVDP